MRKKEQTSKQFVKVLGAGGDHDDLASPLVELCGGGETHGHELCGLCEDLVALGVADSLNGHEGFPGRVSERLHCVVPSLNELLHISRREPMRLQQKSE